MRTIDRARRHEHADRCGDDRDGNWYAVPGVRTVDALGYVTTTKPWSDESLQAIYFLDDVS